MTAYSSLMGNITSLQAWYRLDETSGTVAHDSKNSYHSTLSGVSAYSQAALVPIETNTAMSFNAGGGGTPHVSIMCIATTRHS